MNKNRDNIELNKQLQYRKIGIKKNKLYKQIKDNDNSSGMSRMCPRCPNTEHEKPEYKQDCPVSRRSISDSG